MYCKKQLKTNNHAIVLNSEIKCFGTLPIVTIDRFALQKLLRFQWLLLIALNEKMAARNQDIKKSKWT